MLYFKQDGHFATRYCSGQNGVVDTLKIIGDYNIAMTIVQFS